MKYFHLALVAFVGVVAASPVLTEEDLQNAAVDTAAPGARMAGESQVPGNDGQALQDEVASLIMPLIYNLTNNTNGSCMDPFPVDIFNQTIRDDGGYNKLMLVIIEGTGLSIIGGDRLYMGQPFTAALKAFTLGGLGMWALVDYLNVMCNAIFMDENQPLSFIPQSWRYRDGEITFERYWTDCNLLFARLAAIIFIVMGFMVFVKLAKSCVSKTMAMLKSGFSKIPSMG